MRDFFDLAAIVVVLLVAAVLLGHRALRLSPPVVPAVGALAASLIVLAGAVLMAERGLGEAVHAALADASFTRVLAEGMLSLLLFAAALQIDLEALSSRRRAAVLAAVAGTAISVAACGLGLWLVAVLVGLELPPILWFALGALLAPTEPVAALGVLRRARAPHTLEAKAAGEGLFNNGLAIVIFVALAGIAASAGSGVSPVDIASYVVVEALGGVALGLGLGFLSHRLLRATDDHNTAVLITLALAMGSFALAHAIGVSGPIAALCSGLLVGNLGTRFAVAASTREQTASFWSLVDLLVKTALFLMLGVEVLLVPAPWQAVVLAFAAIPLALLARFAGMGLPIAIMKAGGGRFTRGATRILTWGGLHCGAAMAMALWLPPVAGRETMLAACYAVVVFAVVVQGPTLERVVARLLRDGQSAP